MQLARRTQTITPPGTSRMRTIANELRAQGIPVINFAAGELDVDTLPVVKEGARQALETGGNLYTPTLGLPRLRQQVAALVSRLTGQPYTDKEVGLTAGAKQALCNAALVLIDPGDEVLIPSPYWVTFPTQVELAQGRPVFLDTRPDGYQLTARRVEAALTPRTRALIINTPSNPTGVVYLRDELRQIASLALDRKLWIIFDECYGSLVRPGHAHEHIVSIEPRLKAQSVLVNSFSKSHALTGWRLGFVAAPAGVIQAMENLQGHTTSNPSSLAQRAVSHALEHDQGAFIAEVNRLLNERLLLAREIVAGMPRVRMAPAQGAFYLFLDISAHLGRRLGETMVRDVDAFCELALREARIALVSGAAFGDPSSVRISYALSTQDVVEGLRRLSRLLDQLQD